MEKIKIYSQAAESPLPLPVASSAVQAGFPSPADEGIDHSLDLNTLLIKRPAATFFVRVEGDSMTGAGIQPGDILVVDRSLTAAHGRIVIAVINGEFTVKRFFQKEKEIILKAENPRSRDIPITGDIDFQIWGVVTYIIHEAR